MKDKGIEDKRSIPGSAGQIQTDSFIEWCLFIQNKIGNKQAWNGKYRDIWNGFIEEIGVEVMIGYLMEREFYNAEYAIAALGDLQDREDRVLMEVLAREKYWKSRKESESVVDQRFGDMAQSLAERMAPDAD